METEIRLKPEFARSSRSGGGSHRAGEKASKHELHPRSTKDFETLKLTSADPDVVLSGKSGSALSSKNLSHVPCKFYRQGNCLAGSLCPFSHNLEGTLAADKLPCKYFQKGNCKFGLKCALAHFLPDGTRVNSKSMANGLGGSRKSSGSNNHGHNPMPQPTVSSLPIDVHSQQAAALYITLGPKPASRDVSGTPTTGLRSAPSYAGAANWSHKGTTGPFLLSPTSLTTPSAPNSASPFGAQQGLSRNPLTASPPSTTYKYGAGLFNDSAIADDDEAGGSIGFFEEDFVPGSLGNLILTPQEMQRRDSRSQSGTLLVRPSFNWGLLDRTIDQLILKDEKNDEVFLMD